MTEKLKAPFPWFGGKSRIAHRVWRLLGEPANYVEPFFGSGAVLLLRPGRPQVETVNDLDCYVANFWRATQHDPEAVAAHADGPVNECDLHARHRWLVLSDDAAAWRARMRADPSHYDALVAGWWVWGLCQWIGSGWCDAGKMERHRGQKPATNEAYGLGVLAKGDVAEQHATPPDLALWLQRPHISDASGQGVHSSGDGVRLWQQVPRLSDVGGGVASGKWFGSCDARRAWLIDWFWRLRDRLRAVRVCCGDWRRVVGSDSVTTRLGTTGVFLDPPYAYVGEGGRVRSEGLYAEDSGTVAADVRAWCLGRGGDPRMRIVLAGYEGEGHEALEAAGWRVEKWETAGGYGNRTGTGSGKAQGRRERLWSSPHCEREASLFD